MKNSLLLLVVFFGLLLAAWFVLGRLGKAARGARLRSPRSVETPLSAAQLQLYHRLVRALPGQVVLAHVAVSRVLALTPAEAFAAWSGADDGFDFVVCAADGSVIAAIELEDPADPPAASGRTAWRDRALQAAALRVLRWPVQALPDDDQIRRELATPVDAAAATLLLPGRAADRPAD